MHQQVISIVGSELPFVERKIRRMYIPSCVRDGNQFERMSIRTK
jgi:hypothetical protein